MKIALLGTGFGQAHAGVYAARKDVEVIVFGRRQEALDKITEQFGFATTTDLDSIFDDPSVDLVDVCLPTDLHADTVLRALAAGKHALTELPLAADMASARKVADAAANSDRQVFVDMYERFLPANKLLLDTVSAGTYGALRHLAVEEATALLWPGASLGLHAIPLEMMHSGLDMIVTALGAPQSVEVTSADANQDAATVEAILRYPAATARCSGSSLMPTAWGSRGGYRATFADAVLDCSFTQGFDGKPTATVTTYTAEGTSADEFPAADPYGPMIDHVLACLRGDEDNRISPHSVLDTLEATLRVNSAVNE
ncbi:Gfo/Idh/MocA family protein [Nocardia brasiliensis]|uniref:Gfo/Idh/MocA family protein n=1 Tax=Nocardia brasiliensis TaxID=37326 RepID=UPI00366DAE1E